MIFLRLYFEFFKVGLFAIGGGLATIPFLNDLGQRSGWFTTADVADMLAISESTPGPIGVNMATHTGFSVIAEQFGLPCGFFGGLVATLGLITPAIVVILIVSKILSAFKDSKIVKGAMYGLRAASIGLVLAAAYEVIKIALIDYEAMTAAISKFSLSGIFNAFEFKAIILGIALFFIQKRFKKLHPIFLILIAAVCGIVFKMT